MVPLLFHDSFVPSETAGPLAFSANVTNEAFSVKRLPGPRTTRDLIISSGIGAVRSLSIVLLDVCVRKRLLQMNKTLK